MTTRLYTNVFGILSADLAELEGGAHLTVELVLLLGHLDVVLGRGLDRPGEVRVNTATVRIQVTETHSQSEAAHAGGEVLQSFSRAVQESLTE